MELRFEAAKELLPFMHPKLASIEARTGGMTHEDRLAEYYAMLDEERPDNEQEGGGACKKNGVGAWGRTHKFFCARIGPPFGPCSAIGSTDVRVALTNFLAARPSRYPKLATVSPQGPVLRLR
jgi:hypothetical protein